MKIMLRKRCVVFAVSLIWWFSVTSATNEESVLLLNLFKDEEFSENINSNFESDLVSSYNFDEDNESNFFKKDTFNNTEPELIGVSQPQHKDKENVQVSFALNEAVNLLNSQVTEMSTKKTAIDSKHTINENTHFNSFTKATGENAAAVSKTTELPEKSVEVGLLYPFVRICFDVIASFIQGVMRGISLMPEVSDISTNSTPTEVFTDYSQSPSRIKKRDAPPQEKEFLHSTELNTLNLTQKTVNQTQTHNGNLTASDIKVNLSTSTDGYAEPLYDIKKSSMELITDLATDSPNVIHKTIENKNGNNALFTNKSKKDVSEHNKDVIEDLGNLLRDIQSTPTSPLQEELLRIITNKGNQDLVPLLDDSTEVEHSNSFFLNDFINKQNDPKLKEIVQKQFATAQLYPQPYEGEYHAEEQTSAGTIMMATGAVLVVLVLASVGLATAYKLRLINFRRSRFGNQNPSSQHTSVYIPPVAT